MNKTKQPELKAPWLKYYGDVPPKIDYPKKTLVELLFETSRKYPGYTAYDFMGTSSTFEQLSDDIRMCARALRAIGIKPNDKVTVCLPNIPQTLIMFYAINLVGAVASMIHPLSSEGEIKYFLNDSDSVAAITLDAFYPKFRAVRDDTNLKHLIITSIKDYLQTIKKIGFTLTTGRKLPKIDKDAPIFSWKEFMAFGKNFGGDYAIKRDVSDPAAILYSGGTTGISKGILLSNSNINATALQTIAMGQCVEPGNTMLAVLPMFHGFGLCICIHCIMISGARCLLIPRFTPESYAVLVKKERPNYIAGVPSLFESLLRNHTLDNVDLSCLKGIFVGGDSLSADLKKRVDKFLKDHNCPVPIREGYGTTECVTASCIVPSTEYRDGSAGIPLSDTYYKICDVNTGEELPYGQEGEICIHGPSVMMEYINQPEETANTLKKHSDGYTWLHTGDLGTMDEDGFLYFRQRLKRMIISSGYNIYPSQIEGILDEHESVSASCIIGVPDPVKGQRVKAFVILMPGVKPDGIIKNQLFEYLRLNVARYALPFDIEFREEFPKTLVGKIAYKVLEDEENSEYEDIGMQMAEEDIEPENA